MGASRVATYDGTKIRWLIGDHLGSTSTVLNETAVMVERIDYNAWGELKNYEKFGAGSEVAWFYFTGKKVDEESGLVFFGGRYYVPKISRWLTADPTIAHPYDPQDLNRYTYCRNNPVNLVDPTGYGFKWKNVFKAAAVAVVGVALTIATAGAAAAFFGTSGAFWTSVIVGAASGGTIGGTVSAAMGGDIRQGVISGAISGAVFGGIGHAAQAGAWGNNMRIAAHTAGGAASGGIDAAMTGGDIGRGALIGGFSAGVSMWAGGTRFGNDSGYLLNMSKRAALGGMIGGTVSAGTGGDFWQGARQGAVTSSIAYTANCAHALVIGAGVRVAAAIVTTFATAAAPAVVPAVTVAILTTLAVGYFSEGNRPANLPGNAVEHPRRPGKWGIYGENGKYEEKWRFDPARPGKGGDQEKDHVHVNGGEDHLPPDTPYPDN